MRGMSNDDERTAAQRKFTKDGMTAALEAGLQKPQAPNDAEYWKRRALESEAELRQQRDRDREESSGPRCRDCGVRKARYGAVCGPCASEYDL